MRCIKLLTALLLLTVSTMVSASQSAEQRCSYLRDQTIHIKQEYDRGTTFTELYIKYPGSNDNNRFLRSVIVEVYKGDGYGDFPPVSMGDIVYDVCMVRLTRK